MKTIVAIPCYNCEKQISRVLDGFKNELHRYFHKIVVIDNRSTDNTLVAAINALKKLGYNNTELIQNDHNYGLGGSHKVVFYYAEKIGADYIAILHGDNQAKTEELSRLLDIAKENPHLSAVLGSRFMIKSRLEGYSFLRTAGNIGLNMFYTMLTGRFTKDLGSGLNIFAVKDLLDHRYFNFSDQFTFNMDLLLDYYSKRCPIRFVPITWSETDQISNVKTLKIGWGVAKTVLRWRFGQPLRLGNKATDYTFKRIF